MRLINIVVEVDDEDVTDLEQWVNANFNLISYSIVPDTKKLYETDSMFRRLVKLEKQAKSNKYDYLNKVGYD